MQHKTRISNGYILVYDPQHPNAYKAKGWAGWVYLHIKVAAEKAGRPVIKGENVHHIDGNRLNNNPENIQILTNTEHGALHASQRGRKINIIKPCEFCGQDTERRFCSPECFYKNVSKVTTDDLATMLKTMSPSAIARHYRISFSAVKKWMKKRGLKALVDGRKHCGQGGKVSSVGS
jgi:hypothetical protein